MGILENLGVSGFFSGFNAQGVLFWVGILFLFFIVIVFVGGVTFLFIFKKKNKLSFKNQIPIFKTVNGKPKRIGIDSAKELFIPESNISLFFLKINKTYLARPTRAMAQNEYWYNIAENGEWVNFDLENDPEKNTLAKANYDHRDTRYAFVNLKEIIKRNYKDKNLLWWKDPVIMNIIAFVIMSAIFLLGCWFIVAKIASLLGPLSDLVAQMAKISDKLAEAVINAQNINSGITTV